MAFLELFSITIDKEALGKPNVGAGWGRGLLEPDVHKIDKWLRIGKGGRVA